MKLLRKLKGKAARVRGKIGKHQAKSQTSQIQKLKLQRNKDLREATRLTKLATAKQEAINARMAKQKANAPNVAARKARNAQMVKGAKSAMKGLSSAFSAMSRYANKR